MMVLAARRRTMAEHSAIREHMTVVGADGVHVGTVDHLDGDRIKLTKSDRPQAEDGEGARHHYLPAGLVAAVEGDTVRLRSEEHTSELQSLMRTSYAVFCLKKKNKKTQPSTHVISK